VRRHYTEPQALVPPGYPIVKMDPPPDLIPKESSEEDQELVKDINI